MLKKIRSAIGSALQLGLEVASCGLTSIGAAAAVFFGKIFAAAVLGALSLGIFLRIAGRRKPPPTEPPRASARIQALCAFLSAVEVAMLVEATNLPVRLTQPGFEKSNWLLVLAALLVMYAFQLRLFRSRAARRGANTLPARIE